MGGKEGGNPCIKWGRDLKKKGRSGRGVMEENLSKGTDLFKAFQMIFKLFLLKG